MVRWWLCGVGAAVLIVSSAILLGVSAGTAPSPAETAAKTLETAQESYGVLGVWQGQLALFDTQAQPRRVYEVWVSDLPEEEQERLCDGIPVEDRAAFLALLEEYSG